MKSGHASNRVSPLLAIGSSKDRAARRDVEFVALRHSCTLDSTSRRGKAMSRNVSVKLTSGRLLKNYRNQDHVE